MKQSHESSLDLTRMLAGANRGESDYSEIIARMSDRLMKVTRSMLKNYVRLRRWEQSDDVFQAAVLRRHRSLPQLQPNSQREFLGLAAAQIRRTLIVGPVPQPHQERPAAVTASGSISGDFTERLFDQCSRFIVGAD